MWTELQQKNWADLSFHLGGLESITAVGMISIQSHSCHCDPAGQGLCQLSQEESCWLSVVLCSRKEKFLPCFVFTCLRRWVT